MGIKPKKKCSHLLLFKLPIAQKIYSFISVSARLVKITEVIAPTKLPMAIPDKIKSKLSVLPLKVEILYIIADIIKAKAPENKGIAKMFVAVKPNETAITAPKLAPLDIPVSYTHLKTFPLEISYIPFDIVCTKNDIVNSSATSFKTSSVLSDVYKRQFL